MCLAPGVNIVHQGTQFLGIRVIGYRVVGTKDKVLGSIPQDLIYLSLCFLNGACIDLAPTRQTTQYRAFEQRCNLFGGQGRTLELMIRNIDDTARIVSIVVER